MHFEAFGYKSFGSRLLIHCTTRLQSISDGDFRFIRTSVSFHLGTDSAAAATRGLVSTSPLTASPSCSRLARPSFDPDPVAGPGSSAPRILGELRTRAR